LTEIATVEGINNLGVGCGDSPSRLDERKESRGQNNRGRGYREF
jgi:hypothetical protein